MNCNLSKSFKCAGKGIFHLISEEKNIKIQIAITILVILISLILKIPLIHFIIILFLCFLVIISEAINKCFEKMSDIISKRYNKNFGKLKDMAGGIVLLSVLASSIIGSLILIKPIIDILKTNRISSLFVIINIIILIAVFLVYFLRKK